MWIKYLVSIKYVVVISFKNEPSYESGNSKYLLSLVFNAHGLYVYDTYIYWYNLNCYYYCLNNTNIWFQNST